MAEKEKDSILHGLETPIGIALREMLKRGLRFSLDRLERVNPELYMALVWIFTQDNAKGLRTTFQGLMIAGATLLENLLDLTPWHKVFKEAAEVVLGDLPGAVQDYFELKKGTVKFPPDYTGPSAEDLSKLATQFNDYIKHEMREWSANMPDQAKGIFHKMTFAPAGIKVLHAVSLMGPGFMIDFMDFWNSLSDEDRELNAHYLAIIDEMGELISFLQLSNTDKARWFVNARQIANRRWLPPQVRKQVQVGWRYFHAHVRPAVHRAAIDLHDETERRRSRNTGDFAKPQGRQREFSRWLIPLAVLVIVLVHVFVHHHSPTQATSSTSVSTEDGLVPAK